MIDKFSPLTTGLSWIVIIKGTTRSPTYSEWCEECLRGNYSNTHYIISDYTVWYFQYRYDAIWFVLTWT